MQNRIVARTLVALAAILAVSVSLVAPRAAHAADLTVQTALVAGITPTYASAAATGDKFSNGAEDTVCLVKNNALASVTITVPPNDSSREATGLGTVTVPDGGGVVATGAERLFGPFPRLAYNGSDGKISISYTSITQVCQAGTNAGAVCTAASECPASTCASSIQIGCFKVPRPR